jgi:hypothetical protein
VKQVIAIIFILTLSSSCGYSYHFTKPGFDSRQGHIDKYECKQEASRRVVDVYGNYGSSDFKVDKYMLYDCLRARGYTVTED